MKYRPGVFLLTIFVSLFISSAIFAGDLTVPNTFSSNMTARASEVNANFDEVELQVTGNANDIAIKGDITEVTSGSGLTGSGTSGTVTLSVGTGAITATHLGANSVNSSEIAAGAVTGSKLAGGYANVPISNIGSSTCGSLIYSGWATQATGTGSCTGFVSIQLPHNVTMNSLTCGVFDNQTDGLMRIRLKSSTTVYFEVSTTQANAAGFYSLTDSTLNSGSAIVNNAGNGYFLEIYYQDASNLAGVYPYNCRVYYN